MELTTYYDFGYMWECPDSFKIDGQKFLMIWVRLWLWFLRTTNVWRWKEQENFSRLDGDSRCWLFQLNSKKLLATCPNHSKRVKCKNGKLYHNVIREYENLRTDEISVMKDEIYKFNPLEFISENVTDD